MKTYEFDIIFSNAALHWVKDQIKWIDQPAIVPFIERIPDTLKNSFRKEVIEEMLERAQQPDGTCFETFRRLQIYAQK